MKTILTSGWGLNTRLVLGETHKPTPRDYEVLVEVGAASVNPKDWKLNYHLAILATPLGIHHLPPLFGDDLAGIIVAKGARSHVLKSVMLFTAWICAYVPLL